MREMSFRRLLLQSLTILLVCSGIVIICYFWIDRPVAFYVADHRINKLVVFRWLTYPPPILQSWAPLILSLLMIRRAFGPFGHCQRTLLVASMSLLVADQFRTSLGDVCGRYWPETWFDNNPSLIGNGTYGFHPFVHSDDVGSFPSGHAARILGFAAVWWISLPRSRWLWLALCPPMLASLVAMNYHFVGDVIAGSVLGWIVATYAVLLANLHEDTW